MTQLMHVIIGIGFFNLTWHLYLKKTPGMQEYLNNYTQYLLDKFFHYFL